MDRLYIVRYFRVWILQSTLFLLFSFVKTIFTKKIIADSIFSFNDGGFVSTDLDVTRESRVTDDGL